MLCRARASIGSIAIAGFLAARGPETSARPSRRRQTCAQDLQTSPPQERRIPAFGLAPIESAWGVHGGLAGRVLDSRIGGGICGEVRRDAGARGRSSIDTAGAGLRR